MALPKPAKPAGRSRIDLDKVEALGTEAHAKHKEWQQKTPTR